jgi:hypothetical protein
MINFLGNGYSVRVDRFLGAASASRALQKARVTRKERAAKRNCSDRIQIRAYSTRFPQREFDRF